MGSTAKYPKHSIAFKWQDETAKTILREVDWMASRTGLINPVAVFDPVELEGTIVSRASLHNISILRELKIGLNDEIEVYKANMIIPQIANNITCSNNLVIPDKCPVCNHKTEIVTNNDITYLYCPNEFCFAKFMKRLSLFVSRNAMNIDGISEAILSRLINENMVKTYADLYNLSIYKDKIINFDGFGEKSYNNLIESIEKSRKVKLANFIYSLGIPDIGLSRAKLICNKFNNDIDVVSNLSYDKLSGIVGVGDVIAKEWIDTFKNPDFISEYNTIKKEIILIDNVNNKTTLKDKTFVITGSLNNFKNRDELIEYIESLGGKVVKAISNNVDFLINNDITSTSSKNTKAKELGIPVINEIEASYYFLPKNVKIITITGSNGKTTTTTMVYELLKHSSHTVHVGGNIGIPLSSFVEDIKPNDILVLEISDHQLCDMYHFKSDISVLTNLSETHIDFHGSYEIYKQTK